MIKNWIDLFLSGSVSEGRSLFRQSRIRSRKRNEYERRQSYWVLFCSQDSGEKFPFHGRERGRAGEVDRSDQSGHRRSEAVLVCHSCSYSDATALLGFPDGSTLWKFQHLFSIFIQWILILTMNFSLFLRWLSNATYCFSKFSCVQIRRRLWRFGEGGLGSFLKKRFKEGKLDFKNIFFYAASKDFHTNWNEKHVHLSRGSLSSFIAIIAISWSVDVFRYHIGCLLGGFRIAFL